MNETTQEINTMDEKEIIRNLTIKWGTNGTFKWVEDALSMAGSDVELAEKCMTTVVRQQCGGLPWMANKEKEKIQEALKILVK
jgi:hypothetical protein